MALGTAKRIRRLIDAINHKAGRSGRGSRIAAAREIAAFCGITVAAVNLWIDTDGGMSSSSTRLIEMLEQKHNLR